MTIDMNDNNNNNKSGKTLSRRTFLKALGLGTATATAPAIVSCATGEDRKKSLQEPPVGKMTYRENPKTKEKVSILGYGMMRLPATNGEPIGRDNDSEIDQELINQQIDYAIEHGLNYIDTSPAYCKGLSERATGIALSRHKRDEYFIATKLPTSLLRRGRGQPASRCSRTHSRNCRWTTSITCCCTPSVEATTR